MRPPNSLPPIVTGAAPLPLSSKRQATTEGEVLLVACSYATPPPPPRVPALPPPPDNLDEIKEANLQAQRDPKYRRVSFQTIVAKTTGHMKDGGAYEAHVVGFEKRTETLQGSKLVTVFKIDVTKGTLSWSVFRRHNQFADLDKKLKTKKLLPYSNNMFPSKRLGDTVDKEQMKVSLDRYLQFLLSTNEVATSPYIHNFLEPLQLGDTKPKPSTNNVTSVTNANVE
jgi:hypothetical protein